MDSITASTNATLPGLIEQAAVRISASRSRRRSRPLPGPSCSASVGYEAEANERGERYVGLQPNLVDRLSAMRGPSYSDVILRLASEGGG